MNQTETVMEMNHISGFSSDDYTMGDGQREFQETNAPISIGQMGNQMEENDIKPEKVFQELSGGSAGKKGETRTDGSHETQEIDERIKRGSGEFWNAKGNCLETDSAETKVLLVDTPKRSYSRNEMEALRFVDFGMQGRKWNEVFQKLTPDVVKEYNVLKASTSQKKQRKSGNNQPPKGKKRDASTSMGSFISLEGGVCFGETKKGSDVLNEVVHDYTLAFSRNDMDIEEPLEAYDIVNDEEAYDIANDEEAYDAANDEDDSSSDEYVSIRRPAFLVEGEPDFESGPPLDGLEYLRRVRWEAARIPKVKVVKLGSSKLSSEQTPYMPQIPEIAKCPPNLLPSKHWEDAFLLQFSELRQAISLLEGSCSEQFVTKVGEDCCKQFDCTLVPKQNNPTVSSVLGMNVVSRAAALRNNISKLETATDVSREDCLWLFALCAAVDTPLSAETCASLRCLLRKFSSLLAAKSEPDDEAVMLNILVTIAGKYFRQSDNM